MIKLKSMKITKIKNYAKSKRERERVKSHFDKLTNNSHFKWLFKNVITVISCVLVVFLGIAVLTYATTTIGTNISTGNLTVSGNATTAGNATTTGSHYIGGNLSVNGSVLVSGATGATPTSGVNTRLMWIPEKAAFRAGRIDNEYETSDYWDEINIGSYSFAGGYNTKASGNYTFAFGDATLATGINSIALGRDAIVSGDYAFGAGNTVRASGNRSIGMGESITASGYNSIAIGADVITSGSLSVGIGNLVTSGGESSFGFGAINSSMADFSYFMGNYLSLSKFATGTYAFGINSSSIPSTMLAINTSYAYLIDPSRRGYKIGIKTSTPLKDLDIGGDAIIADPTDLDAEKITNGTFTGNANSWALGTGWAYSSNTVVKNADGEGTLTQTSGGMQTPLAAGEVYVLTFNLTNVTTTNESFTISFGGAPAYSIDLYIRPQGPAGLYQLTFITTNTNTLTITPTNLSRFTLDNISLKKITGGDLMILGNVGIGTTTPARALHISDTMRLTPRATAPTSPAAGDIYVDSTANELCFYDGSAWQGISSGIDANCQ